MPAINTYGGNRQTIASILLCPWLPIFNHQVTYMGIRYDMFVYFTFLVSGVLFIVNGALSGNLWSVAASSAFMLGVTLLIVKLERQREKDQWR